METEPPQAILNFYYEQLFPYSAVYDWLDLSKITGRYYSGQREIAFFNSQDFVKRYCEAANVEEFRRLFKFYEPRQVHVGAVYDKHFSQKSEHNHIAGKEFVVDLDICDYDAIRTCNCPCDSFCPQCWNFMIVAAKCLELQFKENFGWKNWQWMFSGSKGLHCWIRESLPSNFTSRNRMLTAKFLNKKRKKTSLPDKLLYKNILKGYFEDFLLCDYELFENPIACQYLCSYLPPSTIDFSIKPKEKTSVEFWECFYEQISLSFSKKEAKEIKKDLAFKFLYPRLDYNVSADAQHLIRCPFSVHPKTGNLVVPVASSELNNIFEVIKETHIYRVLPSTIDYYSGVLRDSILTADLRLGGHERRILGLL